jgi:hypothetical protein
MSDTKVRFYCSRFPRVCQTLRSVSLKSFYTGFRTKAREFVGKTAICRFVESQIGWGKFLIGGVKGGK